MRIVLLFVALLYVSCTPCDDALKSVLAPQQCGELRLKYSVVRAFSSASCVGTPQSRKVALNCAAGGAASACQSISNGASYFFIFVPNSGGVFNDSTAGPIYNCSDLWAAITGPTPPTDVTGAFFSDPATDILTCTDAGGCLGTSSNCIAGWDSTSNSPTGSAISLPLGTALLACGFINSNLAGNAIGAPPIVGSQVPSVSRSDQFMTITVTGTLNFNTWVDY